MRKKHDKTFKAKIALEALKGDTTLQELANKYEVHPQQITKWKKQLFEGAVDIFERSNKKKPEVIAAEKERDAILKTVGEMKIENDFLKKKIPSTVRERTLLAVCRTFFQQTKT